MTIAIRETIIPIKMDKIKAFFQSFSFNFKKAKIAKTNKKAKVINPPPRYGDPQKLNDWSTENILARRNVVNKDIRPQKTGFFLSFSNKIFIERFSLNKNKKNKIAIMLLKIIPFAQSG